MNSLYIDFILAVGLAMDSFVVAMSSSTTIRPFRVNDALKFAVYFGIFQAVMLVLGWLGGSTIKSYVSTYGQGIASTLLVLIGIKMIYNSFNRHQKGSINSLNYSVLLALAVATSIDALVVGISFTFLKVSIIEPAIIVGCVTFALSFFGSIFGYKLGHLFENKFKILGGLILIVLGISSLFL